MGMEVTMVEPCELVVVRFPKVVEDVLVVVEVLLLFPKRDEALPVPEIED